MPWSEVASELKFSPSNQGPGVEPVPCGLNGKEWRPRRDSNPRPLL